MESLKKNFEKFSFSNDQMKQVNGGEASGFSYEYFETDMGSQGKKADSRAWDLCMDIPPIDTGERQN